MDVNPMFVSTIELALKKIDYEIPDEDVMPFNIYVFKHHFKIDFPYEYADYRPPKYFKLLYKMIAEYL